MIGNFLNYLQSTTDFYGIWIIDYHNPEVIGLEEITQNFSIFRIPATNGSFAELPFGHLIGEISTHKYSARNLQVTGNNVWDQINATTFGLIETFDQGNSNGIWLEFAQKLFAEIGNELMGYNENQNISIFGSLNQIGNSNLKQQQQHYKEIKQLIILWN